MSYDSGDALNLVSDARELETFVVEHDFQIIYADQILDQIGRASNTHTQHDVRHALAPIKTLARELDRTFCFSAHPNKIGGQASIRDRTGGSGQFTDLPRSALMLGYHPQREGYRAVARGKANAGAVPPALVFGSIDLRHEPEDERGARRADDQRSARGPDLRAEEIEPHRPGARTSSRRRRSRRA